MMMRGLHPLIITSPLYRNSSDVRKEKWQIAPTCFASSVAIVTIRQHLNKFA